MTGEPKSNLRRTWPSSHPGAPDCVANRALPIRRIPNINALQLFGELSIQFPGRFTPKQYTTFVRRVGLWDQAARARSAVIGPRTYRRLSDRPRGRRPDKCSVCHATVLTHCGCFQFRKLALSTDCEVTPISDGSRACSIDLVH